MATTYKQDQAFLESMIDSGFLERALDWISHNMSPEDVFTESALENWADENGYVKEEK